MSARRIHAVGAVLFTSAFLAAAQARGQGWEIEVHGGGVAVSTPQAGTTALPPAGSTFVPHTGGVSRAVSSWYFGDGTALFNQAMAPWPGHLAITALDPVLQRPLAERPGGGSVGLRVGRALNPRLGLELNLEYNLAQSRMTNDSRTGLEASSASFKTAFDGLFRFMQATTASTVTTTGAATRQLLATAALNVNLRTKGKAIPYLTVGGGYLWNHDPGYGATLAGSYDVFLPLDQSRFGVSGVPFNESDTVRVRYTVEDSLVGVVGLRVRYNG